MKRGGSVFIFVSVMTLSASGYAANPSATATLTVTGTLAGSLQLVVTNAPGTPTNLNTAAATTALGTFSYFAPPTGFTASNDGSGAWHMTSTTGNHVAIQGTVLNTVSSSYSVTGYVSGTALPVGVSWKLNSVALSAIPATLNSAAAYALPVTLPWEIDFSALATPGVMSSAVTFTATAN